MKKVGYFVLLFVIIFLFLLVDISLVSSQDYTLKVTDEHPFFVGGRWLVAGELRIGDELTTADGKKAKITYIEDVSLDETIPVYNLEALPYHDFIVDGNVVVHNSDLPAEDEDPLSPVIDSCTSGKCNSKSRTFSLVDNGCLLGDTLIEMSDNTYKKIKEIKIGEHINSYDFATKKKISSNVANIFIFERGGYYVINNIKVTGEHPFYTDKGWITVENLKIGDNLFDGQKSIKISSINYVNQISKVYNLKVDNLNNYFADGFLVHNKPVETWQKRFEDNIRAELTNDPKQKMCKEVEAQIEAISKDLTELTSLADELGDPSVIENEQTGSVKVVGIREVSDKYKLVEFEIKVIINNKELRVKVTFEKKEDGRYAAKTSSVLSSDLSENLPVEEELPSINEIKNRVLSLEREAITDLNNRWVLSWNKQNMKGTFLDVKDENGKVIRRYFWDPNQLYYPVEIKNKGYAAGWCLKHKDQGNGYGLRQENGIYRLGFKDPEEIVTQYLEKIIAINNLKDMEHVFIMRNALDLRGKKVNFPIRWNIYEICDNVFYINFYHAEYK